jgi:hypothetical protein
MKKYSRSDDTVDFLLHFIYCSVRHSAFHKYTKQSHKLQLAMTEINFPFARVDGECPSGPPMLEASANKVEGLAYIGMYFIIMLK